MQKLSAQQTLSNIELVNMAEEAGLLKPMIQGGLLPCKILRDRELYYYVDAQRKSGIKMKDIVLEVETSFRVCRATIYNVMSMFGK